MRELRDLFVGLLIIGLLLFCLVIVVGGGVWQEVQIQSGNCDPNKILYWKHGFSIDDCNPFADRSLTGQVIP